MSILSDLLTLTFIAYSVGLLWFIFTPGRK